MNLRRVITAASLVALLSTFAPSSFAATPEPLVDESFALAPPVELVADEAVVEEPAVPPGVSGPDNELTVLYIAVAAAGGFVTGLFVGCLLCFAVYYS